jgi:hypothetical protein
MRLEEAMSGNLPESTQRETSSVLASVSSGSGKPALQAQTEILRRLEEAGQPPDETLRETVEAQIKESLGTAESTSLLDAYVDALSSGGDYLAALNIVERFARRSYASAYDISNVLNDLMQHMTDHASGGNFLVLAPSVIEGPLREKISSRIESAVAQRMEDLGFSEVARSLFEVPSIFDEDARTGAKKALSTNRSPSSPRSADAADEIGDEVLLRRAQSLTEVGAHAEAASVYERLGRQEMAAEAYWRAGRWAEAAGKFGSTPRGELARALSDAASYAAPAYVADQQGGESANRVFDANSSNRRDGSEDVGGVPSLSAASRLLTNAANVRAAAEKLIVHETVSRAD